MIAAVSMGLSIDSSIHYILGFRRARHQGLDFDAALMQVQRRVGQALVLSTLALAVGFTVLASSQFVPTVYFGVLVTLAMLGGLLGNLIGLPLLLLLFYEERKSKRYASLWIGLFICAVGMLHFYNFGICAFLVGLYVGITLLGELSFNNIYKRLSHLIVMLGMPFLLLNIWVHWDAYSTNRTSTPFGFLEYIGQWEAVFLPYKYFPLYQWIDTHITPIRHLKTEESLSYVGVVGTLFFIFLLLSGFYIFWKKTAPPTLYRSHKPFLTKILFSTILLLLFALGIPFIIPGCDWMLDYLGPLRQFRGLGRFCWAFYYVANITAFYYLYHFVKRIDSRPIQAVAFIIPLGVLFYEVQLFQKNIPVEPVEHRYYGYLYDRDFKEKGWLDKIDASEYQAILPLPYQHIGSENIWMEGSFMTFLFAQTTAAHTGLPDMGVMMSRTPIDQTIKSVQMVLYPTQQPAMLSEFLDERPLLVLAFAEEWNTIKDDYKLLLRGAEKIVENEKIVLFKLPLEQIRKNAAYARSLAENAYAAAVLHPQKSGYKTTSKTPTFVHLDFEKGNAKNIRFQGQAASLVAYGDTLQLVHQALPPEKYSMSLWTYALKDQGMNRTVHIYEKNSAGEEVQHRHEALSKYIKTISDGWAMYEIQVDFQHPDNLVEVYMVNENAADGFLIDEFLLRPSNVDFFQEKGHQLAWNGYWYQ